MGFLYQWWCLNNRPDNMGVMETKEHPPVQKGASFLTEYEEDRRTSLAFIGPSLFQPFHRYAKWCCPQEG